MCQTGEAKSFPRTKPEVLGGAKIHLFEFGVKYLNFGTTYLSFGAMYLNFGLVYLDFGAKYLNFGAKIENRVFSNGVGGGQGGSPRTSGRFRHRCREKKFRLPLVHMYMLYVSVYLCICMYVYRHVYMYVYACVYVCGYLCMYIHVYMYLYAYLCIDCESQ